MTEEIKSSEQTPGSLNPDAGKTNTAKTEEQDLKSEKTFTEADLNKIIKERLDRERKKYSDYDELKAAKAKLDEFEKAKLSDEERALKKLTELEAKIAESEVKLKESALRDLKREKVEALLATGELELPKGIKIDSLVRRMIGATEEEIDADLQELKIFFPKSEPSRSVGNGTQQPPAKAPNLEDQINELSQKASDPKLSVEERRNIMDQLLGLKYKAGKGIIFR